MNTVVLMSRKAFNRVWRSRFARNVAVVASGTAGAQAITMAFAPLITRIYGPEAFGLLGTFTAIVAVVTPLAALAYPIAIVLPREDRDALGLVRLCIILSFAMALLATGLLWLGGDWLIAILNAESVAGFLFLIPLAMLFSAWLQIVQQWLIRKKEFGVIARTAVAQSLILNSAKSGIGWLNPVGAMLIVIATAGHLLYAAMLFIGARSQYPRSSDKLQEGAAVSLKELARRHHDFPLYRAPQNFINAASQSLPILMLAVFFGPAAAGFYTLGQMVMGMPSTLIGKAVTDVFYPRITEAAHKGEDLIQHIIRATAALFAIGIVPFGLVILFGPWLFSFAFGTEWAIAGEYARWLALWLLAAFMNRPCVATMPVLSLQRGFLLYEIFSVIGRTSAILLGFMLFHSDLIAIALFSAVGFVLNLVLISWVLNIAHSRDEKKLAMNMDQFIND
ncbi:MULTISPECIES: lipopolysaccharide biosynthesis protein [unclassified Ectothiorhodospira]|uniref:lipopolysaccharide biosynthesis protein n=1 Tax=unclassified Ectothiorhodospira TaxID=2684909 RepID=UPI001EE79172|nr:MULTISPECIES: oligosaccharide flippase family protein [unclassified Ectothiorhodospira]MCG5516370.1 oligosaccharide flippase family protein [Ectothiorhodospira sp. 9100]MCG5519380.1 oligosaccharide flippase family protein [Ectothiorhodospira sp. 9905]